MNEKARAPGGGKKIKTNMLTKIVTPFSCFFSDGNWPNSPEAEIVESSVLSIVLAECVKFMNTTNM